MANWRDPVDERDYKLPPRQKKESRKQLYESHDDDETKAEKKTLYYINSLMATFAIGMLCITIILVIYTTTQISQIVSTVGTISSKLSSMSTEIQSYPTPVLIATEETNPTPTSDYHIIATDFFSEEMSSRTYSLGKGEIIVGTAERIIAGKCNIQNNTQAVLFFFQGPMDIELTVAGGSLDIWSNVYDENLIQLIVAEKRNYIKTSENYLQTGHIECFLP